MTYIRSITLLENRIAQFIPFELYLCEEYVQVEIMTPILETTGKRSLPRESGQTHEVRSKGLTGKKRWIGMN